MQIDTKKLTQGVVVVGFGAVLNLVPVPNKIAAAAVTGIEIVVALIESIKRDKAECGVFTEEEDDGSDY
jgi:hypothetical protein